MICTIASVGTNAKRLLHSRPAFDVSVAGTNGVLLQMLDILFELPRLAGVAAPREPSAVQASVMPIASEVDDNGVMPIR